MNGIEEKMKIFKDNKVVNWHEHVWFDDKGELDVEQCDMLVETAHETYMDTLVCSNPILGSDSSYEEVKKCNDSVYKAMKRHPKTIKGMAFVNPGYVKEALYEIDRCVNDLGMIGVKLYNQYFISEVYYDFTRLEVFTSELEQLIEIAGIDYVVFGSLAPFQYIEPQLVKLHYLKLDMNKKSKIMHENIKNLLNL